MAPGHPAFTRGAVRKRMSPYDCDMPKSVRRNAKQKNLRQWKDAHKRVRTVLLEHWDPIGVRDIAAAKDEYDSIVPQLIRLLSGGATDGQISAFLADAANDMLGDGDVLTDQYKSVVDALRKIEA